MGLNIQVIGGDTTQWFPLVMYHLVIAGPNLLTAAPPAIAKRQVVTPRKILERFIKMVLVLLICNKGFKLLQNTAHIFIDNIVFDHANTFQEFPQIVSLQD
jgi:hypothetical protein